MSFHIDVTKKNGATTMRLTASCDGCQRRVHGPDVLVLPDAQLGGAIGLGCGDGCAVQLVGPGWEARVWLPLGEYLLDLPRALGIDLAAVAQEGLDDVSELLEAHCPDEEPPDAA